MSMKQKAELKDKKELEIIKAVAQAWYSRSGNSKPTIEFDINRRNFKNTPTRFKLEAIHKRSSSNEHWDFSQSLWDSYEIVAVAKRLESGLSLDKKENPFVNGLDEPFYVPRRRRESKNSLRSLFNQMSSRRFSESEIPRKEDS